MSSVSAKQKKTILFLEDEKELLSTIGALLREQGYHVVCIESAESALKLIETSVPDLFLVDIKLPGIDGFDFFEKVRADQRWKSIPVVFLTAYNDIRAKTLAKKQGAAEYITKPFEFDYLVARVREIVPP